MFFAQFWRVTVHLDVLDLFLFESFFGAKDFNTKGKYGVKIRRCVNWCLAAWSKRPIAIVASWLAQGGIGWAVMAWHHGWWGIC